MQAKILTKAEESQWTDFIKTQPLATVHQAPAWGHFQASIPSRGKYWIVALYQNGQIIGGTVLVRYIIRGYTWLYCPRGPLIDYSDHNRMQTQMNALLEAIAPIAKSEKAVFLRIDPPIKERPKLKDFQQVSHGFQPEYTRIINIEAPEPEILKQMKPKGRYNIKLAHKKGVKVQLINHNNAEELDLACKTFYDLLTATTTRDGFHGHDQDYYKNMLATLAPPNNAALYLASYQNQALAAVIVTYFKDTATYYYGASSNEHRNLMGPYALHWKVMQDARTQGYKFYDLFGVAPANAKNHPWQGVTQFKNKFGGDYIQYIPAQEYAYKKILHSLYRFRKK